MSDNWVVQNLENALNTWNEKLAEIWQLITQSPENFKGGAIWNVIVDIHGAVQAIGLAPVSYTHLSELTEQRKGLYSQSRKASGEEKEAVKARLSEITERMKFLRKEVRLCGGIEARSDTLKEKLQVIRADENGQQRKELMKDEHRRRSGGANRENELGGI